MTAEGAKKTFVWCTYRVWSFRILEALLDMPGWRCGLVVTTPHCIYDLMPLAEARIPVLRVDPKKDLEAGGSAYEAILALSPGAIFHYGWSWLVPPALIALCPNVTLHPGKLPKDRGGSPIQNQIRNGKSWTYANVLEMSDGLDEGPVYLRERISLDGDSADEVWARMTSVGCLLSRVFLRGIADGSLRPVPQAEEEPSFYRRVKAEQAEIELGRATAVAIYNQVRAHAETDPNSYVVPAFIRAGAKRFVVERARLLTGGETLAVPVHVVRRADDLAGLDLFELANLVNNGRTALVIADDEGGKVALTRTYVSR